jgi:hypothetical protein
VAEHTDILLNALLNKILEIFLLEKIIISLVDGHYNLTAFITIINGYDLKYKCDSQFFHVELISEINYLSRQPCLLQGYSGPQREFASPLCGALGSYVSVRPFMLCFVAESALFPRRVSRKPEDCTDNNTVVVQ